MGWKKYEGRWEKKCTKQQLVTLNIQGQMCQEGYNIPHSHGNTHPRTHKITFCIRAEGMEYCVTQIVCRFSCFLLQAPSRPPNFSSSVRWTALPLHHVVFWVFFHQRTDLLTEWTEIKTLYMVGFLCTHTHTHHVYIHACIHTHTHAHIHRWTHTHSKYTTITSHPAWMLFSSLLLSSFCFEFSSHFSYPFIGSFSLLI